jgi:hypothetical protein
MRRPSPLTPSAQTLFSCPENSPTRSPVAGSQSRSEPSAPAVTRRAPSGVKAIELTPASWPFQERRREPSLGSQIRTSPSSEAEAIASSFGDQATA